jgi:hypothetical protein
MIRSAIALAFLAAPAIAAPAHRQPTPATVQQPGADPSNPASADEKAKTAQTEQSRVEQQKAIDARMKAADERMHRSMGTICKGC